jgi:hypothetical protein
MLSHLRRRFPPFAFAVLLLCAAPLRAEDIDIFSGIDAQNQLPNVLIIWDSSANWGANIPVPNCSFSDAAAARRRARRKGAGTKRIESARLQRIYALPLNADGTARFNIGLMLFNESGAAREATRASSSYAAHRGQQDAAAEHRQQHCDQRRQGQQRAVCAGDAGSLSDVRPDDALPRHAGREVGSGGSVRQQVRRRAGQRVRQQPHHLGEQRLAERKQTGPGGCCRQTAET